jgi:putative N6-adenine-specific DNA methylase
VVAASIDNARAAGVGHLVRFHKRDIRAFQPPEGPPGTILFNPPYGERIGEEKELRPLYKAMGEVFQKRCAGWRVFMFSGNPRLAQEIGIAPAQQTPLFNGKIRCALLRFDV